MQIKFDTATVNEDELTALIALCASLGGRLPQGGIMPELADRVVPFAVRITSDRDELPASEQLLAAAAAGRPAPPPPADDDEELDASGVPWDERIHSSNHKKNEGDGMWRARRGVSEIEFGKIHAELAALHAPKPTGTASTGADGPAGNSATERPAPPPPADDDSDGPNDPAVAENAPTDQPAAANATGVGGRWGDGPAAYGAFVSSVSAIRKEGIPYAELSGYASMFGAAKFADMKDKPEHWEDFYSAAGGQ